MNYKAQYDKPIVLPAASFISYFFYISNSRELNVVFRKEGRQYRYKISHKIMDGILAANNRAGYILRTIIQNKKIVSHFVQVVPQATIEQITLPAATKYWLAQ